MIFLISQQKYVVCIQKNRLNEMTLLSTQLWVRNKSQFYAEMFCLSKPVL